MKRFLKVCSALLCAFSLLAVSCGGGGGGGAGGGSVTGSSSKAAVVIGMNGLSSRSATRAATSVWDTLTKVDLTVYIDSEPVLNKVLTAQDNVALIEDVDVGSTAYASAVIVFNERNGGETATAQSETITLEPGSNSLTLSVVYRYELWYCGKDMDWHEAFGTYTATGGIRLPDDFSEIDEYGGTFSAWSVDGIEPRVSYPKNFAGLRGNVTLMAEYN